MDWRSLISDKKARQLATIPKEWLLTNLPPTDQLDVLHFPEASGLLSRNDIDITNTDIAVLLTKLASRAWSSVEVTTAFSKRAIIAHQLTNCLTEVFIERALARAAELDEYLQKTGKVVGPLHGLPCSLKDQINIKGLESTMGYASWIGQYAERNAVLVDILESLGAVLFVKTNVPQTLMWPETFNNVFGRTTNPYNRSLSCGGSSGGEGALIALKGSPLGVGSDIGGSIRIPSAFCGLYGLRPCYGRIPYSGCVNSMEGQDSVPSVLGPLCGNLTGIKAFMQGVIGQKPWLKDPLCVRKPWSEDEYKLTEHGLGRSLCFAILWNDGLVVPHPPITRGLEMAKKALLAAGHQVIDWEPLKHFEICSVGSQIWGAGSAEDFRVTTALTGEPLVLTMKPEAAATDVFEPGLRDPKQATSAYKLWQLQKKRTELRQEYLDHWEKTNKFTHTGRPVDAIIAPAAPYAAPPHGMNNVVNYTKVWSILDYPALIIPVSHVEPTLDTARPVHKFYGSQDQANFKLYDPSTFAAAPVAIQLIGRTLEEEAVIAMSEIVVAALKAPSVRL